MATLYLTKDERAIFEKLPAAAKKAVEVIDETLTFEDSEEKMGVRLRNMTVKNPALLAMREKVKDMKTLEEVAKVAKSADLTTMDADDLTEIAFAWGPDVFTKMISLGLPNVNSPDAMIQIAALSTLRHGLLNSLSLSPHT